MVYYAGIDLGKRKSHIRVITAEREVVEDLKIENDPKGVPYKRSEVNGALEALVESAALCRPAREAARAYLLVTWGNTARSIVLSTSRRENVIKMQGFASSAPCSFMTLTGGLLLAPSRPLRINGAPGMQTDAEMLKIAFSGNLYAAQPWQGLFHWGVPWKRNKKYARLEDVQSELKLEPGSRTTELRFEDAQARDFRVPADSPALKMGCYPTGDVPGVRLGAAR